jgi:mannosyltransferase
MPGQKQLLLDSTIFDLQLYGGISRYWYELVSNLATRHIDWKITLFPDPNTKNEFGRALAETVMDNPNVQLIRSSTRSVGRFLCPRLSRKSVNALWHSSYYRTPTRSSVSVCTVHDFIYERHLPGARAWLHNWNKSPAIRAASELICVSESTRRDLLQFYPHLDTSKCHVVYHGISSAFRPPTNQTAEGPRHAPYVMFVGKRVAYKNFALAVRAVESVPVQNLYIVGGGNLTNSELRLLDSSLPNRYRFFDSPTDQTLCSLYQRATALTYLSRCEGFGFPPLEAMACGCPVIAMANSSIPEVVGSAAFLLREENPDAVAAAIRAVASEEMRPVFIEKGLARASLFSWERAVDKTVQIYERALQRARPSRIAD